jgi:hypothetical protein
MNYAQAGRKTRLFFYGHKMSAGLQPALGWNFPLLVFIRVKPIGNRRSGKFHFLLSCLPDSLHLPPRMNTGQKR